MGILVNQRRMHIMMTRNVMDNARILAHFRIPALT